MTEARRAWWVAGGWFLVQLSATSVPGRALPSGIGHPLDYAGHLVMYGVLGLLVARAASLSDVPVGRLPVLFAVLAFVAAGDELHQLLIPGRSAAVADWLSDTLGAGAGLVTWTVMARRAAWRR